MSGKSFPGFRSRMWSRLFRRSKKRVSTILPHSPPVSPPQQHVCLPGDNTGTTLVGVPGRHADTHPPPSSDSHSPSISNVSTHSTSNLIPSPSPQHLTCHSEGSAYQNYSSTHLAPSPTILHFHQGNLQGPSHLFSGAHNFVIKDSVFNDHSATTDNFMKELLEVTIIGAEFDSSDRAPPPRCHPGTRLQIIQRCLDFIEQCQDDGKLRWIFGPAGVGKSAIMQMVTEKIPNGVIFASIFFSVNGRRDGTKVVLTIAYQLAVKYAPYRRYIQEQITLDPSLLRKSLLVQFNKFIVEPFMLNRLFEPSGKFLIAIDGLDECSDPYTQEELLKLITDFCLTYPTSSVAWIVASRPEPHITAFFDQEEVKQAYTKEEIEVNSDEACKEVEQYLRDELKKIQSKYPTLRHKREWPSEHEFTKIASSAGGLFAYAATVVRYIGDPHYRDPAAQLRRVLETIDGGTEDHIAGNDHPMFQLDALYKKILSDIPTNTMINTRKVLAGCFIWGSIWGNIKFRELCNRLGLTEDDAYGAIRHLHALMMIPEPDKADDEPLSFYHKSFQDFLSNSTRSGFSDNFPNDARQLCLQASLRIIGEVPYDSDGMTSGEDITVKWGLSRAGSVKGCRDNITLSWPGDERFPMNDHQLRTALYSGTMGWISTNPRSGDSHYGGIAWFHALTTRFTVLGKWFSIYTVRDCAFDKFRHELTELGKLKQVPLRALDYAAICGGVWLQFKRPIETDVELSERWNSSCKHGKKEKGDLQQWRGWRTVFERYYRDGSCTEDEEDIDIPRFHDVTCQQRHQERFEPYDGDGCIHCSRRLARHFVNNQDLLATVFVDGTQLSYVELSFVDPDDGVSEWTYQFLHSGPPTSIDA